jgi:hypothetical protein
MVCAIIGARATPLAYKGVFQKGIALTLIIAQTLSIDDNKSVALAP